MVRVHSFATYGGCVLNGPDSEEEEEKKKIFFSTPINKKTDRRYWYRTVIFTINVKSPVESDVVAGRPAVLENREISEIPDALRQEIFCRGVGGSVF